FEPTIDYVVTKMPRFAFEKFPGAKPVLTTAMKSVGEAMSIGRSFAESVQKALRSMEIGLTGFNEVEFAGTSDGVTREDVIEALAVPRPDRLLVVAQALRHRLSVAEVHRASCIDPWFIARIAEVVAVEDEIRRHGLAEDAHGLMRLKQLGFSDARLAELAGLDEASVAARRRRLGVTPVFKRIDTCAAEFPSRTPYLYSCYEAPSFAADAGPACEDEAAVSGRRKIVILGGGPNRIGQGIEFDYCCVHAVYALHEAGFETIMVNCNPETVSTDYDTADRLYFEPVVAEDVIALIEAERAQGDLTGVIVQFGGQTPLKLAGALERAGIPILGTQPEAIDLAEDRERFQQLLARLELRQPPNGTASSLEEAEAVAERVGYPAVIRPSYVLGGQAMEIVHDRDDLVTYMQGAIRASGSNPVLIDRYLQDAIEVDVDAVADGASVYIGGVMEHIEEAGVHSGDSACALPPHSLDRPVVERLRHQTGELARALGVIGLMNVQFAVKGGEIYVLEVNPRASRTVPFVAKATGVPIAKIAARVMAGERLADFGLGPDAPDRGYVAVKEAVFPFARFPGVDVLLGPEMKSTGEVMGLDPSFAGAFAKAQLGAGNVLPLEGTVFISVKDQDKSAMIEPGRRLVEMGFRLIATDGTAGFLSARGLQVKTVNKVIQGSPHAVDAMLSGEVKMVFNTTLGRQAIKDSFSLRETALMHRIPYFTTVA
ncbi:MAG: carbamoyl-phosphate synthase large subunit, partial [Kiloniellales bacterium]